MENVAKELMDITKEVFQDYYQKWEYFWNKSIRQENQYFEEYPDI